MEVSKPVEFEPVNADTLRDIYELNALPVDAVPTPLHGWNVQCRDEGGGVGIAHGWNVVIGARTGAGKSLAGLNIACCAMSHGQRVAYLSLEMSHRQLLTRALAILTGKSIRYLEPGGDYNSDIWQLAAQEWEDRVSDLLYVNTSDISTLDQIRNSVAWLHNHHEVRYFIVDYLQLAWVAGSRDLLTQITEVSHTIRQLAHGLNVVTVGLSQFNRSGSQRETPPTCNDLMGGSPLENDADQVLLFDHTTYAKASDYSATQKLILDKNRHGSQNAIPVVWDYKTLTLTEGISDDDSERVPF